MSSSNKPQAAPLPPEHAQPRRVEDGAQPEPTPERSEAEERERLERKLDEALDESFPASDPLGI